MRKVFTYSRKKPFSNIKNIVNDENLNGNIDSDSKNAEKRKFLNDSDTKLITSIISEPTDSLGNTPQTKRHKDIRNFLTHIDSKLKFLDLNESADFHKLYRHKNIILAEIRNTSHATLSDLFELLEQKEVLIFESWFKKKSETINKSKSFKLGEATFSEVFKFELKDGSQEVIKIIPLELETCKEQKTSEIEIYPLSINVNAAIHECTLLNEVESLKDYRKNAIPANWTGFNSNREICVVKGKYPRFLIENWIDWDKKKISENGNPKRYNDEQHFLIITMEDGGTDLEHYKFKNMRQVQSVVNQLVYSLSLAEEKIQFEHRDLHLGNILVKETKVENFMFNNESFDYHGIQCSIIDYSLSRMQDGAGVAYRDLESIAWIFAGDDTMDSQYKVYKDMKLSKGQASWKEFQPRSNILWLAFILERLVLKQKKSIHCPKQIYDRLFGLYSRILRYSSVKELKYKDEFFV